MISQEILNIDWLSTTSEKLERADKILLEKVCRAMLLLEGLTETDLDFIFKGGTAVMLLLEQPRRFSIDIDILVREAEDFESHFGTFINQKGFTRFELQKRMTDSDIIKLHYKFYYSPVHRTNQNEEYVLLDILVEKAQYRNIERIPVDLPFIVQTGNPAQVNTPVVNDIIADKLTAFAPNTTGIPYKKNAQSMSLEIIKQLYDIGTLFEKVDNPKEITSVFQAMCQTELKYRKMNLNPDDVLDDILLTALCISSRGKLGKGNFEELQAGIRRLTSYIFSERYHIEKANIHAARAAYLASLIKYKKSEILFYDGPEQVIELGIKLPRLDGLNKLRRTNPEAFFYWYQVATISGE